MYNLCTIYVQLMYNLCTGMYRYNSLNTYTILCPDQKQISFLQLSLVYSIIYELVLMYIILMNAQNIQ